MDVLQAVVDGVADAGQRPVLVFDDTDRWLRGPAFDDAEQLRNVFFERTMRWLSDHLQCGIAVAMHEDYLRQGQAPSSISHTVRVPVLGRSELAELLAHRLDRLGAPTLDLVIDEHALDIVHRWYANEVAGSVRSVLRVLKRAAVEVSSAGTPVISAAALRALLEDRA